ncbi:hypothetical protein AAFC00_001506 [Neodothiora populina]|uniref:Wbp11/ELF5/Saf1 N-terminal domain-containing protein n=1 Tax=Neodothiora populina TaxID=2781224 RepID=A0ABR3PP51_9PEZI
MPKERSINPAQAQRKLEKTKALKKSKAEQRTRNNEKLARRNPERLQKQIDELRELEKATGSLRPKDKQTLEQLEKDVKAVRRAREAMGDEAPVFKRRWNEDGDRNENGGSLGKRRRDHRDAYKQEDSDVTDEDVRNIPMPRDTPPPIPRRERARNNFNPNGPDISRRQHDANSPAAAAAPLARSKTVYSSAPVLRDLAQESKRFVPSAVAQKLARTKGGEVGSGRLLEPEELDNLEKAGYGDAEKAVDEAEKEAGFKMMNAQVLAQEAQGEDADDFDIDAEARRFEKELKNVEMEEVADEDL